MADRMVENAKWSKMVPNACVCMQGLEHFLGNAPPPPQPSWGRFAAWTITLTTQSLKVAHHENKTALPTPCGRSAILHYSGYCGRTSLKIRLRFDFCFFFCQSILQLLRNILPDLAITPAIANLHASLGSRCSDIFAFP